MESLSTQTDVPLTQLYLAIANLVEALGPKPALMDQNKWDLIKTVAIPRLARFSQKHPRSVLSLGACSAERFDNGERFRACEVLHHVLQERVDYQLYNKHFHGEVKTYIELLREDDHVIRIAEQAVIPAFRAVSDLTRTCAQQKQCADVGNGIAVLYGIAGLPGVEFVDHCAMKLKFNALCNETRWMFTKKQFNLDSYKPSVRIGRDLDINQQVAAQIVMSARLTNVNADKLL